jgi:energy-coupling factor transport system ATP-binding protein
VLEVQNVSFGYRPGQLAIADLSLAVADGDFIGVAGRNGSGKTTLTRLIMGLEKCAMGRILLDGRDVTNCGPADMARHIGYVFQNPDRQIFRDTVAQEVAYGPEQLGFAAPLLAQAVEQALAVTGLGALAGAYPRSLSKGQKQRVAIASALAMQPRLLILDEPTSGQDTHEKGELLQLLTGLNAAGLTVLLVTHDMELLTRYTRRVVVLADGRKVFDGDVASLFAGGSDLKKWGLRAPAAVNISRELAGCGVPPAMLPGELQRHIVALARRERHA